MSVSVLRVFYITCILHLNKSTCFSIFFNRKVPKFFAKGAKRMFMESKVRRRFLCVLCVHSFAVFAVKCIVCSYTTNVIISKHRTSRHVGYLVVNVFVLLLHSCFLPLRHWEHLVSLRNTSLCFLVSSI